MPTSDPSAPKKLRREAAPLEFTQLTSDQQRAGVQAAGLLAEMSERELREPESSTQHPYLPEIDPIRDNHVVLIDGRRGSGKSQLLLTLLKSYRDAAMDAEVLADFEGLINPRHRIIPVGLIDLQPLPDDTNLLFHILGHLERVVEAIEGEQGELRQRVSAAWEEVDTQELPSRRRWRELARAAAFGWGGNLKERKARLDPEAYAVEIEHGELQRLDAMHRFRCFMEELASDYQRWRRWDRNRLPFFLLAVDDADMNPERSGELLELARKLWHRRLGFILTGDSHLFVAKLQAELERQMSKGDLSRAKHLAHDIYEKIIPRRQRCALPQLEPDERLLLPQPISMRETLQNFPVDRALGTMAAHGVQNLAAFFEESSQIRAALPDRLRSLLSMQEELESIRRHEGAAKTARAVLKLWESALGSAQASGFEVEPWRELVRFEVENKLLVVKSTPLKASFEGAFWESAKIRPQWEYAIGVPSNLRVLFQSKNKDVVELPSRALGAFLLAHEFVQVDARGAFQGSIIPEDVRDFFVRIEWNRSEYTPTLVFEWFMPEWGSFIDFLRFLKGWKQLLGSIPTDNAQNLDRLGWGFLNLVVQIATGSEYEPGDVAQEPDWSRWGNAVVQVASSRETKRAVAMRDWALRHSSQLATPEAGTSAEFAKKLLRALSGAYGRAWKQIFEAQTRARLERMEYATSKAKSIPKLGVVHLRAEDVLGDIDKQFPRHPFVRQFVHPARRRLRGDEKVVERFVGALGGVYVPVLRGLFGGGSGYLSVYVNSVRRRLLGLNPADVLERMCVVLREYANIGNGAPYAVVALWGEFAVERNRVGLKAKVALAGERVVVRDYDLRQRLHEQLKSQWAKTPRDSWSLRFGGLVFQIGRKKRQEQQLEPSMLKGLEPVLRIVYDYAVDQDDLKPASHPSPEWWPHVKVSIPDAGIFAPWPVVSWPSLWEWEVLQEAWNEVLEKGRLLANQGAAETSILDALAGWLLGALNSCKIRNSPGSQLRVSQGREDWRNAVNRFKELELESSHHNGSRANAIKAFRDGLGLLATPESGLSVDAAEGILDALVAAPVKVRDGEVLFDKDGLKRLRIQRMLDAGIPESRAEAALHSLDEHFKEHPWVKRMGRFRLPKKGADT